MSRLLGYVASFAAGGAALYFTQTSGCSFLSCGGKPSSSCGPSSSSSKNCSACGKAGCKCTDCKCGKMSAVCVLNPDNGSNVRGIVSFTSLGKDQDTSIRAEVSGLAPGSHGFHIHQFGDLSQGCKSAKGHYNPFKRNHGGPNATDNERHVGDLGNIMVSATANADGTAILELTDPMVKLIGPYSVIGRSVVIHAGEDDLGRGGFADSLTTGHAGARVACGVIGRSMEGAGSC